MANEKFEPVGNITDVEIKLECLRLATDLGPEYDRKDPISQAQKYFDWVKQVSSDNPKRTARKKV